MPDGFRLSSKTLLHLAMVVFLGVIAYSNTFHVPFVFDDEPVIVQNPRVKDVSNVPSMFVEMKGPWSSRPLMHAANALNYYFGGQDTTGYHALNLALHLLNGVLLYFLVMCTGRLLGYAEDGPRLIALASSMLFVLHPMQTEGVNYIVSRSALFATCFFFSGILLFVRAVTSEKRRGIYFGCLFVASLLGMASREDFATFPVVLFLYDLFFMSGFSLRRVAGHLKPYIAVIISLGYMAYLVLNNTYASEGIYSGEAGIPPAQYVLTQFNVQWTYLRLLVLPVGQSIDHDYHRAKTLFELPTFISFMGYAGLAACCVFYARKLPAIAFGVLWFLITLAPISFFVAVMGLRLEDVMLEHRIYLPDAGIFVSAVTAAALLIKKFAKEKARATAMISIALLAVVLVPFTYARNSVWESNISLWEDVVRKAPGKWRGYYNLANEYADAGDHEKAIGLYLTAIRLNPEYPNSHNNLGISYRNLGLTDNAIEQFLKAIEISPNHAEAYNNLGNIYLRRRLYNKAIENYRKALEIKPDYYDAHYNMGIAYYYMENLDMAVEHYMAALRINPNDPEVHHNLGVTYLDQGKADLARREVETALRLDPGFQPSRMLLERLSAPSSTRASEVK